MTDRKHRRPDLKRWRQSRWLRSPWLRSPWLRTLLLMGVYIGVIYALMVQFIGPVYSYIGYTYTPPSPWRNTIVIVLLLGLSLVMPHEITRPSRFVLWMHFLLATAPSMLVPQFTSGVDQDLALEFAVVVALGWLLVVAATSATAWAWVRRRGRALASRLERVRPRRLAFSRGRATTALIVLCLAMDAFLVAQFGLRGSLSSLTQVRDVRLAYREELATVLPGTAYVLLTLGNVVGPLTLMRSLTDRRWVGVGVGVLGQVLVYSIAGYKMVLLSIPALLILFAWHHYQRPARSSLFLGGVVGLMTLAWAAFVVVGSRALAFLFVLRMVLAPGNLSAAYLSIFHDRDPLYWGYSFLSRFVDYPYSKTPNYLVGELFRHDPETSANVNLFGDGFISMRWGGMLLECVVLAGLLLALDAAARRTRTVESCAAVLLPTFALANSNVFTSLTTHGFLAAVALLGLLTLCQKPEPTVGEP